MNLADAFIQSDLQSIQAIHVFFLSAHTKTTAVSYAHQGIFYIKNSNILKIWVQFTITIFYLKIFLNVVYSCNVKAEFSGSMLQVSVSHDLQKSFWYTDLLPKKYSWLLSMLKTAVCLNILVETVILNVFYFQ